MRQGITPRRPSWLIGQSGAEASEASDRRGMASCGGRLPLPHGTQGLELLYFLLGVAVFTQNVLCVLSVHGRRHPDTGGESWNTTGKPAN